MESDDVYGRQWHVILPVKWKNIRDKPGMQFITEVPFVPETRFTRLPATEVTDTDVQGNRWGGQWFLQIMTGIYFHLLSSDKTCPVVESDCEQEYISRPDLLAVTWSHRGVKKMNEVASSDIPFYRVNLRSFYSQLLLRADSQRGAAELTIARRKRGRVV